jgi:poly(A) polymerase
MLRAIRFAVKLGFNLDSGCQKHIKEMAELLSSIPSARIYDEVLKLFLFGYALQTFEMLRQHGLFQVLFPATEKSLANEENGFPRQLLVKALQNSDNRIADGKSVTAYFLFASFLWEPVQLLAKQKIAQGLPEFMAYQDAASEILSIQIKITALPRHISLSIREVWSLQPKFNARVGSKPSRLITHPRFRAAYDFLLLRAETGGADPELAEWWYQYQNANENEQRKMTAPPRKSQHNKSGRRKSYRKKSTDTNTGTQP